MKANIKKILAGGLLATCVAVPTSLFMNQRSINQDINEQLKAEQEAHKFQMQQHEQKTADLLKSIDDLNITIEGLTKTNKELESRNSDLEDVRFTILNNLGYELRAGEVDLLQRLVECEAGAEPMEGRIAVVNVVMNRIKSEKFPDSITEVIYQKNQFEPVVTGIIYQKTPSEESKEAVRRALMGERVVDTDIVNFWASWLNRSNPIWKHVEVVTTIGVHHFGREWK